MKANVSDFLEVFKGFTHTELGSRGVVGFVVILLVSLFCSYVVSWCYLYFYQNRSTGSQIHRCFPLLGISVTGLFVCIQFSLPLSLGLLGALSIVRFRTPIKEPEEIGFLMLLISVSIACATFNLIYVSIILATGILGLYLQDSVVKLFGNRGEDGMLMISLPEKTYLEKADELFELLKKSSPKGGIDSISQTGERSVINYSFIRLSLGTLRDLEKQMRNVIEDIDFNVFYHRQAA